MELLEFDAVIIGGGSAGYAAARTLVQGGARVAVIDGAAELGGLCILRGCMPTKSLLHAAELRQGIESARSWGIHASAVTVDPVALYARKSMFIEDFAGYRRGQLESGRFTLLRSLARFVEPHVVELQDGRRVRANSFVIATGSTSSPMPLPALESIGCWTSDEAVTRPHIPKSLIVLGGGAVAVEFAQFYARLGTRTSLIQRGSHLLRDFDADAAVELEKAFRREGIELHTGTRLIDARRDADGCEVVFESVESPGIPLRCRAEVVLHAMGRSAATRGLGLESIGVQLDKGRIVTDASQRSSVAHIFAAGDCTGPHDIVHLAIQQGEVAAQTILKPATTRRMDYRVLLSVVFTDPQLAQVGLTEKAAARQGMDVAVASYPFADHGKAMILDSKEGFVKLIARRDTGEIVGGTCVGPQAGELIHEVAVAMAARMNVRQFAIVPHYHPTLAEIWTYPAEELADALLPEGK